MQACAEYETQGGLCPITGHESTLYGVFGLIPPGKPIAGGHIALEHVCDYAGTVYNTMLTCFAKYDPEARGRYVKFPGSPPVFKPKGEVETGVPTIYWSDRPVVLNAKFMPPELRIVSESRI